MTSKNVVSRDGTTIAYERLGAGHPIVVVDGALCSRRLGPGAKLGPLLARHFSVFTYDRRGRGESTDAPPYAVERELDDLAALLAEAGRPAFLFGSSSGAVLALEAATRGLPISGLALFEAPFIVDRGRPTTERDWERIDQAIADGRRTDAVRVFLKSVGMPGFLVALMRILPIWSKLTAVAHTLSYDGAIVKDYQRGEALPKSRWGSLDVPTLVLAGGRSPAWMQNGALALANLLPNAEYRTLEGQTHDVSAKALAPVLDDFFSARREGLERRRGTSPA